MEYQLKEEVKKYLNNTDGIDKAKMKKHAWANLGFKEEALEPATPEFKPIELILKIETIEEARLMYHVYETVLLKDLVASDALLKRHGYNKGVSESLTGNGFLIRNKIEKQGYEV